MNTRSHSLTLQPSLVVSKQGVGPALRRQRVTRSPASARHVREKVLATVAFLLLILAWDASMRVDERTSSTRMQESSFQLAGKNVDG